MGHLMLMREPACCRADELLQAAATCFVEEGFHGASMSRIAKRAKMSPGHIYHYFDSKEAIISEIVRREEEAALAFFKGFEDLEPKGIVDELRSCVREGVAKSTDLFHSVLLLEILAEAARSDHVRTIVQEKDREIRTVFTRIVRDKLGFPDAEERVEFLFTLFSGLAVRIIRNPEMDREAVAMRIEAALHSVLVGCSGGAGLSARAPGDTPAG